MKKISIIIAILVFVAFNSMAQTTEPPKKEMTKEEKAAAKAKKEADLAEMFKELGLTEEQITKFKEINADANKKSNVIKEDTKLTDAEKEDARKVVNDAKNTALKVLLGEEKFKQMNAIKKRQKAAAEANSKQTN